MVRLGRPNQLAVDHTPDGLKRGLYGSRIGKAELASGRSE